MADRVGMSLDEIISKNKSKFSTRRGRGGRGRGRGRGLGRGGPRRGASAGGSKISARSRGRGGRGRGSFSGRSATPRRGNLNSQWNNDLYYGGTTSFSPKNTSGGQTKLVVGNLYFGVSDSDIRELFAEFGNIRSSAVHYDKSGRSLGTAHVIFERKADALKAMNHYHNVDLDNRPMKITIEDGLPSANVVKSPVRGGGGGGRGNVKRLQKGPRAISNGISQRGNKRGRGRGGRNRGGGRGQKKPPTAEELDAELEAYSVQASK